MKFFKYQDFIPRPGYAGFSEKWMQKLAAVYANQKLENLGIKITYHDIGGSKDEIFIEIKTCKHPLDSVGPLFTGESNYICDDCGASVKPIAFEEA